MANDTDLEKSWGRDLERQAMFRSALLALAMIAPAASASARTIDVAMKNSGAAGSMVFEPAYVKAEVGDVVHFVPVDPGHNAQTIDGMIPQGVPPSAGQIGKPFDLRITKPGLYGIECRPHFGLGMVALIKAGNGVAPNESAVRSVKLPFLAARRMNPMIAAAR